MYKNLRKSVRDVSISKLVDGPVGGKSRVLALMSPVELSNNSSG